MLAQIPSCCSGPVSFDVRPRQYRHPSPTTVKGNNVAAELTLLLGPLQNLLGWFQKNRLHKDAQKDAALESINRALFASMRYAEEQRNSNIEDRSREFELAELWANAAAKVRHASQDLSSRLQDKSIYWTKQMKWSHEEVVRRRIDFEAIQSEIAQLLDNQ